MSAVLALTSLLLAAPTAPADPVLPGPLPQSIDARSVMLVTGSGFSDDEDDVADMHALGKRQWLAFFDGSSSRLQTTGVWFKHEPDNYGPRFTAQARTREKPFALFAGIPDLREGPVTRWMDRDRLSAITEAHPVEMRGGNRIVLEVSRGEAAYDPASTAPRSDDAVACRLVLIRGHRRQLLDQPDCVPESGDVRISNRSLSIVWAGDLDHDGKPDFIFDHDLGETAVLSLALSSKAKGTDLLMIVAVHWVRDWC